MDSINCLTLYNLEKILKNFAFFLALSFVSLSAWANPQTITLDLPTMDCPMCPITVKMALNKVEGVNDAEVSLEKKQAVVTFEDTKTTAAALVQATTNAGYPSTVKK